MGYGRTNKQARCLSAILSTVERVEREFSKIEKYFDTKNKIILNTPDKPLNLLYNTFLSYQVIYSRIIARTGFYQCSGATGFRDQLQDCLCLSTLDSRFLKKQLVAAASSQFEEGDVLHWWHNGYSRNDIKRGVRTRSSDDLLWLPFAACEYVDKTNDIKHLQKKVNYINAPELKDNEDEKYLDVSVSTLSESIYEHCKRAVKRGITEGNHGLLLFGNGDWNDGMNKVGAEKKGETVWCSFFAIWVLDRMSKLSLLFSDNAFSEYCVNEAKRLRESIDKNAWDGEWYLRGFFDNGNPLGSHMSDECKIDLLPQSFASIVGGFDPSRVRTALKNADKNLVDRENNVVKLFMPPFIKSLDNPGYVMGYIAGVRENGGQYTHSAIWYALALFADGQYDEGYEILSMINPVNRSNTLEEVRKYRVEPYVLAADVYSNPDVVGMGGWSQYTGAAGWYYKVVTETLLGIKRNKGNITINPHLPQKLKEYRATLRLDGTLINLMVKKSSDKIMTVDGIEADKILLDGKKHEVLYLFRGV